MIRWVFQPDCDRCGIWYHSYCWKKRKQKLVGLCSCDKKVHSSRRKRPGAELSAVTEKRRDSEPTTPPATRVVVATEHGPIESLQGPSSISCLDIAAIPQQQNVVVSDKASVYRKLVAIPRYLEKKKKRLKLSAVEQGSTSLGRSQPHLTPPLIPAAPVRPRDNEFFAYMLRREALRRAKEDSKSAFPWTSDSILCWHKFTNVKREYDRTTRFARAPLSCPLSLPPLPAPFIQPEPFLHSAQVDERSLDVTKRSHGKEQTRPHTLVLIFSFPAVGPGGNDIQLRALSLLWDDRICGTRR